MVNTQDADVDVWRKRALAKTMFNRGNLKKSGFVIHVVRVIDPFDFIWLYDRFDMENCGVLCGALFRESFN